MTRIGRICCLVVAMVIALLWAASVAAAEPAARVTASGQVEDRNVVNFRVGATSAAGRPQMCLEGSPHHRIGLEACGTGATWFHNDDASPQLMHLRANVRVASFRLGKTWLQPRISAGVTELQVGEDAGGLDFFGTGPSGVETAGPEVGASLRMLAPIWGGLELIGQIDATVSYLPHAPQMVRPQPVVLPTATVTFGFGF
jgi:hypothetical protein